MNKNIQEILAEKIAVEIDTFRASYKDVSTEQAYNDWYVIGFYEDYYEMLSTDYLVNRNADDVVEWLAQYEKPLKFLYRAWMDSSGVFSRNWEDMLDWVREVYDEKEKENVEAAGGKVVGDLLFQAEQKAKQQSIEVNKDAATKTNADIFKE